MTTELELRNEFSKYMDQYGIIHPDPFIEGKISQNGLLFTSEYYIILSKRGWINDNDKIQFIKTINSCKVEKGVFRRHPSNPEEQEGPDDYVGICAAASVLELPLIASEILEHGRSNPGYIGFFPVYFNYNNVDPRKVTGSSFLGRQQQLICHFNYAAKEKPPLYRRLIWAGVVSNAGKKKEDQDAHTLSWLLCQAAPKDDSIAQKAVKCFMSRLNEQYPGGMGEVIGNYFNNHNHPLSKYWVT